MTYIIFTMALCGVSQWFNQRLAASVGTLLVFGCLLVQSPAEPRIAAAPANKLVSLPLWPELYVSKVGESVYHAAGCPLGYKHDVIYRSQDEAVHAGKRPCTFCLSGQAGDSPAPPSTPLLQTTGG